MPRRNIAIVAAVIVLLMLSACASDSGTPPDAGSDTGTSSGDAPVPGVSYVLTPEASGTNVETSDQFGGVSTVDYSNVSQGYVMIRHSGSEQKLVAYIEAPNGIKYQYPLQSDDSYVVCPLQAGDGQYIVQILENVGGTNYRALIKLDIPVTIEDSYLPFLYPSCKVNFTDSSDAVALASKLTGNATTDLSKIEAIYDYVTDNIKYDKEKAKTVKSGYAPNPDDTLNEGKGICSDYSALLAAMLRSQGIPTMLVEGNVAPKDQRHAWNQIFTEETGLVAVVIDFDGNWELVDSTFAASMGQRITGFIGDGSGYTEDKCY